MSEYKNANTSFKYKCKICGYEGHTNLSSIFSGHGCMRCGQLRTANLLKEDIEVVRQYFIEHGCVPLFTEYINGHTPLEYICSCGSKSKIAWFDFRAGKRCNNCRMERIHNTMYQNGTQMCSLQQRYLHKLFGGELNYPVGNSSLDIAFPDKKIYIEYDGSGHDLTVKRGDMSRHDFEEREKRRTYKLWRMGWKCVRIISRRDNMPSDDVLQSMLDKAFDVLNDHSWITFDIDNNTVEFSADKYDCDYGETKRMRVS
jgi:very-short-patch-repair endonuclease